MRLTHGDTVALSFADLAEAAGVDLADVDILAGDVVVFSLAEHLSETPLITLSSADDGPVTFTPASGMTPLSGSVAIASGDWQHVTNLAFRQSGCPWDLQRTRATDNVLTVMQGTLTIVPDVTP